MFKNKNLQKFFMIHLETIKEMGWTIMKPLDLGVPPRIGGQMYLSKEIPYKTWL
jgi:hypothetical protein